MTEYDYSPDAVERFQAKMAGVGKWANDQRYFAPKYSNPFIPEDQASSSRPAARTPARQETYPQPAPRHHDRPQPTRSRTLPAPVVAAASPPPGHTSRAYAYAAQPDPRAPHPSSSSRNRSGSQPPAARYPYPTPVAPGAHQPVPRASPAAYPPPPPPPGTRQVVMEYKYVPGQAIKLPPPRRGEQYIIVPPKGGRLEVVTNGHKSSSSHTRTMSHSRSSGSRSKGSPTKTGTDPLFKRLVANLTPKIEWGDGRSSGRSMKRDNSRRRSASR
ncbi:hypothetical protein L226DRAFT_526538 [Lentinus tigrinus ALCF2SS1-7]|uniref:Uncharacterized protein n=1 Tax=Lentinus tigrinus ALCF2SS1-6 TaxID=1328759 RepID=A0A5C2SFW7_9APHY|nr:hypothetical protein L227DRAFT_563532 [Lentinus tigrinus ALCF2SS1-6]RPD69522.1 hypothetical protein L226DRAFT_526538 [Lentinus tigrinus ALCF2SS1-7]